jgi:hypothetical protein
MLRCCGLCIFEAGQGSPGSNVYFPVAPAPEGRSQYKPNPTLLSTYDQVNDVRYSSYFKDIEGRLVLSKYLAKSAQLSKPDGVVNFKAFRTGEMYLIRAEASARNGDEATARDDLNTLRAASYQWICSRCAKWNGLDGCNSTGKKKRIDL